MNKIIKFSILLPIIFVMTSCFFGDDDDDSGANILQGDKLPTLSITLNNGKIINNQALEKKISVIILFTVTCPDCQALFPDSERIYNEYKDNPNFVMFGISREQGKEQVSEFWQRHNYLMPYSAQDTRYVYSLFAQSGVPRVYISDGQRTVQKVFTDNPVPTYEEIKQVIDSLL